MLGLFVKRHAECAAVNHRISVIHVHATDQLKEPYQLDINEGTFTEYIYYYRRANTGIEFLDNLINLWKFIKCHLKLKKQIDKPDLLHVHILTRLGVLAFLSKVFYGVPYMVTEHWSRYHPGNRGYSGWLRKALTRRVVKKAKALTTVTKNLQDSMALHELTNPKHYILPNVVDTNWFKPGDISEQNDNHLKMVHLSCFDDEPKNISGLIETIASLGQKRNDFSLDLIGQGKDHAKMVTLAKQLGIYDELVFFRGEFEGQELGDKIRSYDLMVLFSNYENLPVVIIEGFCCGLPVISSDVGGIKEIVNEENGLLVAKGDKKGLEDAMVHMIENIQTYDRSAIANFGSSNYSRSAVTAFLDNMYSEVL